MNRRKYIHPMLLELMVLYKLVCITSKGPLAWCVQGSNESLCCFLVMQVENTLVREARGGRPCTISFFCKVIKYFEFIYLNIWCQRVVISTTWTLRSQLLEATTSSKNILTSSFSFSTIRYPLDFSWMKQTFSPFIISKYTFRLFSSIWLTNKRFLVSLDTYNIALIYQLFFPRWMWASSFPSISWDVSLPNQD